MHRLKRLIPSIAATVCMAVHAQQPQLPASFEGTGRACAGALIIESGKITWNTPFSQCKAVPYELIEKMDDETKTRTTYRIHATAPECLYQVLSLTHLSGKSHATGWEVTAYGSESDYRADKADAFEGNPADAMSCYLVPTSYGRKRPQR